jgi:hypothetical protein
VRIYVDDLKDKQLETRAKQATSNLVAVSDTVPGTRGGKKLLKDDKYRSMQRLASR